LRLTLDSLVANVRPAGAGVAWSSLGVAGGVADGRADIRALRLVAANSEVTGSGMAAAGAGDSLSQIQVALHTSRVALVDLRPFFGGVDLVGDAAVDLDVHGPRVDRLSGSVEVHAEQARVAGRMVGPTRLQATLVDGRADLTATTTHEGAGFAVRGWIRPIDADPAYDLTLQMDRLPRRLQGIAGWEAFARRAPTSAELRVRGHGYANAVLDVTGSAKGPAGSATLDARVDASHGSAWEVRKLAFTGVDVARLAGDTTASVVTGLLTARGRGFTPDSLHASGELNVAESSYGSLHLRSVRFVARADGPAVRLEGQLEAEAGRVSVLTANARLDGARPFHARGLRFDHLDLSRAIGDRELASDLNGTLALDGSLGPPLAVTGRALLEPSRLRGRAVTAGSADIALKHGTLALDAQLDTDAGRIALTADGRPFATLRTWEVRDAHFTNLDLGAWGIAPVVTHLNGRLTAAGSDSTGSAGGLEAHVLLDRSRVGALEVEGGDAQGRLRAGHARAQGSLRTKEGAATFTGEATWDAAGAGANGLAGKGGFVLPFSVLAGLAGRDTLASTGALYGDVTFGPGANGDLQVAGVLAGRGSVGLARIDMLFAGLRLDGATLQVDTLDVRSNVARARAFGRIALRDTAGVVPTDLTLTATVIDLSPLAVLVGADTLDAAGGEFEARLEGPASARTFHVTTSLRTLAWTDVRLLRARIEAQGTLDRDWHAADVSGTAEMARLHSAMGDVQDASGNARYTGGVLSADLDASLDDRHHLRLGGSSTADSLGRTLALTTFDLDADDAHWRLTGPARLRWGHERLEIANFETRSDSGMVRANGVLDRRGTQDFRCEVRGAGLDILSAWFGRPQLTGRLDGEFSLVGPADAPRGAGWLRVAGLVSGEPVGDYGANFAWDGRRLDAHSAFTTPDRDSLVLTVQLPLEVSPAAADSATTRAPLRLFAGDVDLRFAADRFPLRALLPWLPPSAVSALDGTLDTDARLTGRGDAFHASGHVTLSDGSVGLPALGARFDGIRLDGALSGNQLEVREARATSGKGEVKGSGELRFVGAFDPELDLAVNSNRFTVMNTRDVRAIVSADLKVAGRASEPHVTGKASVGGSYYYVTQADLAAAQAAPAVPLTPADVRMMEETFGYLEGPAVDPALALYDASNLDVQIELGRDNWLRQRSAPRFAVEATGDVRLKKPPHAEPELFGRIAPVPGHGYVEQFGRTFDIAGGEILLNGGMEDHTVDLRAEYKTRSASGSGESDVVVHLGVTGPVDKLRLALTSDPPLSENDILTFIATGRDPTSVQSPSSTGASSASLAADYGMSQLTGGLQSAAQEKAGLDVLQIRFDAQQGATLVAGRYVGSTVYLGVRQPLQYHESGTTDTVNPYRTRFEVEYEKYQWLVLNLQGEVDLLRAFLRARYAY
jgi:translocation and assembly module TamB